MNQENKNQCFNPIVAGIYLMVSKEWLADQRKYGYGPVYSKLGEAKNAPIRYEKADLDAYIQAKKVKVA